MLEGCEQVEKRQKKKMRMVTVREYEPSFQEQLGCARMDKQQSVYLHTIFDEAAKSKR